MWIKTVPIRFTSYARPRIAYRNTPWALHPCGIVFHLCLSGRTLFLRLPWFFWELCPWAMWKFSFEFVYANGCCIMYALSRCQNPRVNLWGSFISSRYAAQGIKCRELRALSPAVALLCSWGNSPPLLGPQSSHLSVRQLWLPPSHRAVCTDDGSSLAERFEEIIWNPVGYCWEANLQAYENGY